MEKLQQIVRQARATNRASLDEQSGKAFLSAFGITVPQSTVVEGVDQVEQAVAGMKPPWVLKVMSADILHKSDAGGVALNLTDAASVKAALETMAQQPLIKKARVQGYLIEEMTPRGTEIVVGAIKDPQFGLMIMVGLGGIFVEVLKDVSFRICPIRRVDARAMLAELKGARILDGVRGQNGVDQEAIVDILMKIGGPEGLLMSFASYIEELDINPIIATAEGAVAVDARFILSAPADAAAEAAPKPFADLPVAERFEPLFAPKTIAVLGASTGKATMANTFIQRLVDFGYAGHIYPVHPKAEEVEGLKCYPSLGDIPEVVDYAYVAIGAARIPDALAQARGNVKFAQVISSGFGEVAEGHDLQRELVAKAHQAGCRVLGPNCLGLYSPRGKVTFPVGAPPELGTVGIVSQSGGLGTDIIKRGQWRGLRFSGLVTVGNSADLGPVDLCEFYLHDPHTKVIGLYVEDIKQGRRFFELLEANQGRKPVVILRGGTSAQGKVATASHTGALSGSDRGWEALVHQTGCALVSTVDEFINALLAFQCLEPHENRPTRKVTLFGNGGGSGVLATDFFSGLGLDVLPFDAQTIAALEALDLPPGSSVINPIDTPVATLQKDDGKVANRILDTVYTLAKPDAVVMHLNLAAFAGRGGVDPIDNLIKAAVEVRENFPGQAHFMLALRVDGSPELDAKMRDYRQRALAVGIPVYDELPTTAKALKAVSMVEHNLARRS